MPNLETFDLYVKKQGKANEGEEKVEWATLETLTSHSVMPRLRRYSFIYNLSISDEIQHIFQSSLFNNDKRHIRIQFALHINSLTSIDLSDIIDICNIHSTHYNNIFVQYNDEDKSKLHYTLFTSSWPSWTIFWMNHHNVAPRSGVYQLGIKSPNISLHSLGKLCSDANELVCQHPASFSMVDSLIMTPTALINLRCLEIHNVVPGLELLFDGNMLPRLHSLRGLIIPLFVAFASRANQMKTLDTVDHLAITDQGSNEERCFSFKQWHIVLDALPRLRTLLVQLHNGKCPPMVMADLFVNYIKRTTRAPLNLFSCCIDHNSDGNNKEDFIIYLEERIEMNPPKPEEYLNAIDQNIVSLPEESHYESPTSEPIQPPLAEIKPIESTTKDSSSFSPINIDAFKERTFEEGFESLPKPKEEEHLDTTNVTLTSSHEEPHYELPKNEPIQTQIPIRTTFESIPKDSSIFSRVNIDKFKERTFEKSPKNFPKPEIYSDITIEKGIPTEEPYYQLPSSEPVPPPIIPIENEYSTVDRDTYDVPRTIELQQITSPSEIKTDVKTITDEPMIPSTIDIQKSSGDFLTNKTVEEKVKIDKISPVTTDITPSTDIKGTKIQHPLTHSKKTKKSKEKKPKTEKKSGVLSTFFQHNKQKSKVPALDLPPVERDLSSNTQLCPTYQSDNNPLHIPSTNLPKLDIPLPTYDRPEVNMTTGKIKQTSEFAVPIIDLTPIPNLNVSEDNKQLIDTTSDHMKIPNVQLPNLQFTNDDEQKINKLSHTEIQTKIEEIPKLPTIENDQKNLPIQTETIIPKLSSFDKTEISIKPELSPIEQKITINETNIDQLSKPSVTIENKTSPNFNFQLPPTEPVSISSKTSASSPPSFDDNVPSQIISTRKPSEKQLIETKSEPRKKSSILSLCSCFSNKSTPSKDKIPSIQAPKTNLPEVNIPPSSSNISSTLKTQGSLRAPSNNLPQLDLTPTSVEPVTVPTIHIQDKKQEEIQAPRVEKQLGEEKIKVQTDTPTALIETQKVKDIQVRLQKKIYTVECKNNCR
ncbi:unnamed protein product [Rotaria sordida]|uniref:Uncharacterized protein n=1 Tax=Rotaria sordida TaxID=392033 RepID=A0A819II12_9BILA|nr:unnamed protein product [Rotaria sordida]